MSKCIASQCIGQLELDLLESKTTVISFDGDDITSAACSSMLLLLSARPRIGSASRSWQKRLLDNYMYE